MLVFVGYFELVVMNCLKELKNISNDVKWWLVVVYVLVGKKNVVEEIVKSVNINFVF